MQRTLDGGKSWKNVTPKGLPAWSKISTLDVSPLEPGVVYAAVDAHRLDDFTPHAYRTRDGGESWQEISAGLPPVRLRHGVRADTARRGLLYAGTDTGMFVSFDDGNRWQPLQANLPVAWVSDLKVHGSDLVISTQGRGLWVLDDVTPLRQLTPEASSTAATLVAPAETIRVRANHVPRHAAAAGSFPSPTIRLRARSSTTRSAPRRKRCASRSSTRRERPCASSRATIRRRR